MASGAGSRGFNESGLETSAYFGNPFLFDIFEAR